MQSQVKAILGVRLEVGKWRGVGIVGGLGPLAGAMFYEELIAATGGATDQDHLPVVLISDPAIPSRSSCLLEGGPSPAPALRRVINRLAASGAEVVAVPSTTTHAFFEEFSDVDGVECVDLVYEVGVWLSERNWGATAVFGTTASRKAGVYERCAQGKVEWVYPNRDGQERVQGIIDGVKGGVPVGEAVEALRDEMRRPWCRRVEGVLLACTELSGIGRGVRWEREVVGASEILAAATVRAAGEGVGGKVAEELSASAP